MGYATYDVTLDVPARLARLGHGHARQPRGGPHARDARAPRAAPDAERRDVHVVTAEPSAAARRSPGRAAAPSGAGTPRTSATSPSRRARRTCGTPRAPPSTRPNRILPDAPARVAINTLYRPGTRGVGPLGRVREGLHRAPLAPRDALPLPGHDGRRGPHRRRHGVPDDDARRRRPQRPSPVLGPHHETGHMWFPMIVGSNETAYTWMDEGLTSYDQTGASPTSSTAPRPSGPRVDAWARVRQAHFSLAGTGQAVEPMRHNDLFPIGGGTPQVDAVGGSARTVASYSTPAVMLHALEGARRPRPLPRRLPRLRPHVGLQAPDAVGLLRPHGGRHRAGPRLALDARRSSTPGPSTTPIGTVTSSAGRRERRRGGQGARAVPGRGRRDLRQRPDGDADGPGRDVARRRDRGDADVPGRHAGARRDHGRVVRSSTSTCRTTSGRRQAADSVAHGHDAHPDDAARPPDGPRVAGHNEADRPSPAPSGPPSARTARNAGLAPRPGDSSASENATR